MSDTTKVFVLGVGQGVLQHIDVTYIVWNIIYLSSSHDSLHFE